MHLNPWTRTQECLGNPFGRYVGTIVQRSFLSALFWFWLLLRGAILSQRPFQRGLSAPRCAWAIRQTEGLREVFGMIDFTVNWTGCLPSGQLGFQVCLPGRNISFMHCGSVAKARTMTARDFRGQDSCIHGSCIHAYIQKIYIYIILIYSYILQ